MIAPKRSTKAKCLGCGRPDVRTRGLCGTCYQAMRRLIEASRRTDRPIDWDSLVRIGKAAPSHGSSDRRALLSQIQDEVYSKNGRK